MTSNFHIKVQSPNILQLKSDSKIQSPTNKCIFCCCQWNVEWLLPAFDYCWALFCFLNCNQIVSIYYWQQISFKAYKYCSPPNNKGHITPVPPHNGHLLTSANFHCPQGYHCTETIQIIDIFFLEILRAFQDWHANNSKWKLYIKSVSTVIPNNMECHIHLRENLHWGSIWCLQIIWFFSWQEIMISPISS